jgi:biopolymer transport protein ExbD
VWIVETNQVYRAVPFTVAIDWIQQGRLLVDDQLRVAGTEKWVRIGNSPSMAAYLPKAEAHSAGDQAEALEAVAGDFAWKRKTGDEDDDVDMIPLIDISLVLLVFFMMTSTVIVSATSIDVPAAENSYLANAAGTWWVGVDRTVGPDGQEGPPIYSFGEGEKAPGPDNLNLTEAQLLERLSAQLRANNLRVDLRIAADKRLPAETVMNLTAALEKIRAQGFIHVIRAEVNERRR